MQARLKRFLPLDRDFEICGCNLYAVHQRVAKKFRSGRAILAGDSAHVNSPIGGMGLNSGVHDAFNLADKRLLEERDPVVRQRNHDELKRASEEPALARKFLLRASLLESVREAEAIM
jgi:3-(3-hydroxy-phenyl)propionate hydroxylase